MSHERLERLLHAAERDPELHDWLRRGIAAWQQGEPLETALDVDRHRAVRSRDFALRAAAEQIDPDGELSTWKRAERLSRRISTFEANVWPRYRDRPEVSREGIAGALLQAFRAGVAVPKSTRHLYSILK